MLLQQTFGLNFEMSQQRPEGEAVTEGCLGNDKIAAWGWRKEDPSDKMAANEGYHPLQ